MSGRQLPITWRPRMARLVAYGLAVVVLALSALLAFKVPAPAHLYDRIGFLAVGLIVAGLLHLLARCRVRADETGLTVVNVARVRRLQWAEVLDVGLAVGEPWPTLDLADGTTLAAMGIQSADGERARRAVGELRELIHARGEAHEPT